MGEKWLNQCQTKKMREAIEFEHGVRYTEHLIDPMHNLMLGI